jgi:hypothetical protein
MKLAVMLVLCLPFALLLLGCAAVSKGGSLNGANSPTTTTSSPSSGGTTVGPAFAKAEVEPVGDSDTHATAVFKGVGTTDVQVELDISGLPTKDPDATYYAQVHRGSCSDEPADGGHEGHGAGTGPAVASVSFEGFLAKRALLAKAAGLQAHGGEEPGIPEEPPGSIEQPVSFGASSSDGSAFVSSLLEGVGSRRLRSGGPKYVDVHAVRPEWSPEDLACGDLKATKERS